MKKPARFISLLGAALLVMCAAPKNYAQDGSTSGATPGYARMQPINIQTVVPFNPNTILDLSASSANASTTSSNGPSTNAATTNAGSGRGNIAGLDTVPTFSGAFFAQGGPSSTGTTLFKFTMMGNDPLAGDTTTIPAKITEVSLQLLNADGSQFKVVPYAPFEDIVEDSPNFEKARYTLPPTKRSLSMPSSAQNFSTR